MRLRLSISSFSPSNLRVANLSIDTKEFHFAFETLSPFLRTSVKVGGGEREAWG